MRDVVLPEVGRPVQIHAGGRYTLAVVKDARAGQLMLAAPNRLTAGEANVSFVAGDRVVSLLGTITEHGMFTVDERRSETLPQQRSAFRVAVEVPAAVRRQRGVDLEGQTVDLSVAGVRLAGCADLKLHEPVVISLDVDGRELTCRGEVVRCEQSGMRAVAFTDLNPADERALNQFLLARQRETLMAIR